jgi:uncharacterized membrane protein
VTAPQDDSYYRHSAAAPGSSRATSRPGLDFDFDFDVEAEAEVEAKVTERVITFSDAVVAIAITLLALGLAAPKGVAGWTNGQLLHELRAGWPDDLAFLISFLVIGNHWKAHRSIFRYVQRWNVTVGRLNMLWLLMMIMTPFAADLLAGHGAFGVRFTVYALIQVIATGSLMLMSREVARGRLLRPDAPDRARHPDMAPYYAFCIMFLVAIPVAFVTGWAYALWGSVPLVSHVLRRVMTNGRHGSPSRAG